MLFVLAAVCGESFTIPTGAAEDQLTGVLASSVRPWAVHGRCRIRLIVSTTRDVRLNIIDRVVGDIANRLTINSLMVTGSATSMTLSSSEFVLDVPQSNEAFRFIIIYKG